MEVLPETFYDPIQKIWSGPKRKQLFGPDITIGEAALTILNKNPEKVIEISESTGEQLTAAELIRNAKVVARNFQRLGLQVGDVIGLYVNNSIHLSSIVLGAFLSGTPTNAVFPKFDKETVGLIFNVTCPKVIICELSNYNVALSVSQEYKLNAQIFVIDGIIDGLGTVEDLITETNDVASANSLIETYPCSKLSGNDTAVILCSSGTTGPPKGMMCSHTSLLNSQLYLTLTPASVLFMYSTLQWISGYWNMVSHLITGCRKITTNQPFSSQHFVDVVENYKVTHFLAPPSYLALVVENQDSLLRRRLSSIDTLICAGSSISTVLKEKWIDILDNKRTPGFTLAYGFSEIACTLTQSMTNWNGKIDGADGKLVNNFQVRIMSENWEPLGVNEIGMICVLPSFKWSGYYRNPEATKKTMYGDWIISGDIGFFDDHNNLHICSRYSDVFKSNGFQIYPERIEEVVLRIPGVLEACVFGIPAENVGHLIACAIVRSGNDDGKKLTPDFVINYVKENIMEICHLTGGVYFMDSLPKTSTGKPQRNKVWDILKNNLSK